MSVKTVDYGPDALRSAEAGWPVLPLAPNTKLPLLSCPRNRAFKAAGSRERCDRSCGSVEGHGLYDGTTDLEVVARWWRRHPEALIGARVPDALVVLDVDPRNGGDRMWADLLERLGELPDTLTQRTPSGGWHYFFGHPGGALRGDLGAGVDVKAGGKGLVVLAPSARADGRRYEWAIVTPAVALPEAWARAVRKPAVRRPERLLLPCAARDAGSYLATLCARVANAPEGTRNLTLNACAYSAGRKVAAGELVADDAHRLLLDAARLCGLDETAAEGTIVSGLTAGRAA